MDTVLISGQTLSFDEAGRRLARIDGLCGLLEAEDPDDSTVARLRRLLDGAEDAPHRFDRGNCLDCTQPAAMHNENHRPTPARV